MGHILFTFIGLSCLSLYTGTCMHRKCTLFYVYFEKKQTKFRKLHSIIQDIELKKIANQESADHSHVDCLTQKPIKITCESVSDCCLTPTQQFFSYIMERTS